MREDNDGMGSVLLLFGSVLLLNVGVLKDDDGWVFFFFELLL